MSAPLNVGFEGEHAASVSAKQKASKPRYEPTIGKSVERRLQRFVDGNGVVVDEQQRKQQRQILNGVTEGATGECVAVISIESPRVRQINRVEYDHTD